MGAAARESDSHAVTLPALEPVELARADTSVLQRFGALEITPWPHCMSCGKPLDHTPGDRVARWLMRNCRLTAGRWVNQPLVLTPTQWQIIRYLSAQCCPCGRDVGAPGTRRYRWALVGVAKKAGLPGKTTLLGAYANYLALADGEPDPLVVIGAGADEQANLLFGAARSMVELSPRLTAKLEPRVREILLREGSGSIRRVSAATGTNDGPNISAALLDELHVWTGEKGEQTWTILTNGGVVRTQPITVQITTAGHNLKTICGRQYDHGRKTLLDPEFDPRFFFYWRQAPKEWPLDSPHTWAVANAGYGELTDEGYYLDQLRKKSENDFRRYFLNQWTKSGELWLPTGSWDLGRAAPVIADKAPTWVSIDLALYRDSVGVTWGQWKDDRAQVRSREFKPVGGRVDLVEVESFIIELDRRYDLQEVVYDPRYLEVEAQHLLDQGVPMVEFPQHPSRMIPACQEAYELIVNGRIAHGGDVTLEEHVMAAERRNQVEGWTLSKSKSASHIDLCVSLVMLLHRMQHPPAAQRRAPRMW